MRLRALAGFAFVLVACSRDAAQPTARSGATPPEAPTVSADTPVTPPSPALAVEASGPLAAPRELESAGAVTAWTDPRAVEELAVDCNVKPSPPPATPGQASPLACATGLYEASSRFDPCYSRDQSQCKPRCERACDACSDACSSACTRCKSTCVDGACRHACALTCGNCKQGCLTERDQCASGVCGKEYEACVEQLTKRWSESGCAKTCSSYQACTSKCQEAPACVANATSKACTGCHAGCAASVKRGCPPEFVELCFFNGAPP